MSLLEVGPRLHSQEKPFVEKKVHLTYNPDFDTKKYQKLQVLRETDFEEYEKQKQMLDGEVRFNLQTTLGERYNAGLSSRKDRLINGEIVGQHSDEPLIAVFERGRDYRYDISSEHDRLRESAEVEGFKQIQHVLGDNETPVGTMLLSVSPPGGEDSQYQHNFYDIFTLKEDEGERYIESARYSSALERSDYMHYAALLQPGYFRDKETTDEPLDVYFLNRPIIVDPEMTGLSSAESLHELFHSDHETLSHDDLLEIIQGCDPISLAYINVLAERPEALIERNLTLNALFNKADILKDALQDSRKWTTLYERTQTLSLSEQREEINRLGRLAVREVDTGCGFSGGFAVGGESNLGSMMGPFSVSEFGLAEDKYGKRTFACPHCAFENKRPFETLIKYCQSTLCRRDVSCT